MRIVAGKYRGLVIDAPKGKDVRPTTDRVREAMFSSLISLYGTLEEARVLDVFAGSGALSAEALSRGAGYAVLCEKDKKTCKNIEEQFCKFKDNPGFRILNFDVFNVNLEQCFCGQKFDIVFLDPPYKFLPEQVLELMINLKKANVLATGALIIYEHSKDNNFLKYEDKLAS